jgi:diaminohydroxyphosphoribosylaminopyrimidine deaminase/5-amino-6-(5-phosphoribosylamino)uracil reductase
MSDTEHMRAAVGCVVVKDGRVVGRATTAPGGRPHAEPQALAMAGADARGATVYVTLEPCCHHGRTPPCTDALIAAGVARVVIAVRDCDNRVNGAGTLRLRAAGIIVEEGLLEPEAQEIAAGFFSRMCEGRPLVTLKLATTLDGRIATRTGESKWITGDAARRMGHALRGRNDATMVGVGTVLADDPELTCRLPGFKQVPDIRVVLDSHLRTPLLSRLVATAQISPTWILHAPGSDNARLTALANAGVELLPTHRSETGVDLAAALKTLAQRGITRLLVEGGAQLAASLLRADLVDRIAWFHAPGVMGGDAWPAAQAFGVSHLADMPRFIRAGAQPVGVDMLTELRRAA